MTVRLDQRLRLALRIAAIGSWAAIVVLSLVPGQDRPHTGWSGDVEHATAYLLSAAATRGALSHVRSRWLVLAFAAASAVFEVAQMGIPGRSAGAGNWAASSAGALAGVALARPLDHWLAHRRSVARFRKRADTNGQDS